MAKKSVDMTTKYLLSEKEMPTKWYNIQADLKTPLPPPLHPGTGQPIGPQDLAPLFPMELIKQEVSQERWIEIPDEVRDILRLWRPTPLYRARRLEKALDTPAHIYYKYEGVSPAGSHKPNTAIAQAYYNKQEGVKRLSTETGAGQWGSRSAHGLQLLRPGVQGLHGQGQLPAEAVSAHPDGDLRRPGRRRARARTPRPARRSSSRTRTRRAASASRSARRSRTRPRATTPSTRSAAC